MMRTPHIICMLILILSNNCYNSSRNSLRKQCFQQKTTKLTKQNLEKQQQIIKLAQKGNLQTFRKEAPRFDLLNFCDPTSEKSPLSVAAQYGNKEIVTYIISTFPDDKNRINIYINGEENSHNYTVLHWLTATEYLSEEKALEIAQQLIAIGARPDLERNSHTPVLIAYARNWLKLATLLSTATRSYAEKNPKDHLISVETGPSCFLDQLNQLSQHARENKFEFVSNKKKKHVHVKSGNNQYNAQINAPNSTQYASQLIIATLIHTLISEKNFTISNELVDISYYVASLKDSLPQNNLIQNCGSTFWNGGSIKYWGTGTLLSTLYLSPFVEAYWKYYPEEAWQEDTIYNKAKKALYQEFIARAQEQNTTENNREKEKDIFSLESSEKQI